MNKSRIEWCDYTWNPVTGCRHGCSYCYARRMCTRFAKPWGLDPADPFKPTFHPKRLTEPMKIRKPSRIFVGSMADLFGDWDYIRRNGDKWPSEWVINHIVQAARDCPRHTFIFLTKNPRRYAEFDFPPNCWLGVSVTGESDIGRIYDLTRSARTEIRFVSWEPILDRFPLVIRKYHGPDTAIEIVKTFNEGFSWLILGAMTGPGAKKYAPRQGWIRDAVDRCRERGIPVFMKNSIRPYWDGELIQDWPK